jgi:hypothetical protein
MIVTPLRFGVCSDSPYICKASLQSLHLIIETLLKWTHVAPSAQFLYTFDKRYLSTINDCTKVHANLYCYYCTTVHKLNYLIVTSQRRDARVCQYICTSSLYITLNQNISSFQIFQINVALSYNFMSYDYFVSSLSNCANQIHFHNWSMNVHESWIPTQKCSTF